MSALGRWAQALSPARLRLWRCASVGDAPTVLGRVWIHGGGTVRIGDRVVLDGRAVPIELHAEPGGEIVLGDDVHIEGGASLEAQLAIHVGSRCRVGSFAKLLDNHFHPVRGDRHQRPASVRLVVEDDVEIGARAILLPGAQVQRGAKIGPGAVVSRRIPPGAEVGGTPLRNLRGASAS